MREKLKELATVAKKTVIDNSSETYVVDKIVNQDDVSADSYLAEIIKCMAICTDSKEKLKKLAIAATQICKGDGAEMIDQNDILCELCDFEYTTNGHGTETVDQDDMPCELCDDPTSSDGVEFHNDSEKVEYHSLELYCNMDQKLHDINRLITNCADNNDDINRMKEINDLYSKIQELIFSFENSNAEKLYRTMRILFNVNQELEKIIELETTISEEVIYVHKQCQRIWKYLNQCFGSLGCYVICPESGERFDEDCMLTDSDGFEIDKVIQIGYGRKTAKKNTVIRKAEVKLRRLCVKN